MTIASTPLDTSSPSSDPMIRVDQVSRVYHQKGGDVYALNQVTLEIQPGEFTVLMGPSGSGKTTLLNLIGALDLPTQGDVYIQRQAVSQLSHKERTRLRRDQIGFIFQAYNLLPVLSAYENAEFVLLAQGVDASQRKEEVYGVLEAVGLKGLENRRPSELSGGQQQRVAIARAIAGTPALILADEPTANLDSHTGQELIKLMKKLNQERGLTFVFATHDPQVMEAAHRVIRLVDGQIVEDLQRSPS